MVQDLSAGNVVKCYWCAKTVKLADGSLKAPVVAVPVVPARNPPALSPKNVPAPLVANVTAFALPVKVPLTPTLTRFPAITPLVRLSVPAILPCRVELKLLNVPDTDPSPLKSAVNTASPIRLSVVAAVGANCPETKPLYVADPLVGICATVVGRNESTQVNI